MNPSRTKKDRTHTQLTLGGALVVALLLVLFHAMRGDPLAASAAAQRQSRPVDLKTLQRFVERPVSNPQRLQSDVDSTEQAMARLADNGASGQIPLQELKPAPRWLTHPRQP